MNPVQRVCACMRARPKSLCPWPVQPVLSHTIMTFHTMSPSLPLRVCHEFTFQPQVALIPHTQGLGCTGKVTPKVDIWSRTVVLVYIDIGSGNQK